MGHFWPPGPVLRTLVQYLIAFCSRPEADSDVISCRIVRPIVPDKLGQFRDPRLNCSREIPPAVVGGIFNGYFRYAFWLEIYSYSAVISGVEVG